MNISQKNVNLLVVPWPEIMIDINLYSQNDVDENEMENSPAKKRHVIFEV